VFGNLAMGNCRPLMPDLCVLRTLGSRVIQSFVALNGRRFVGIGERDLAAKAYAGFGKGRHPAALNMGDCLAYACAKANQAALLFKGDDFRSTGIRVAR
jgi:ribonuclease VapC